MSCNLAVVNPLIFPVPGCKYRRLSIKAMKNKTEGKIWRGIINRGLPSWSTPLWSFWFCNSRLNSSRRKTASTKSSKNDGASPNMGATWIDKRQTKCIPFLKCKKKKKRFRKIEPEVFSFAHLLERLQRKTVFKSGQKDPHQGAKVLLIYGTKLFRKHILKIYLKHNFNCSKGQT